MTLGSLGSRLGAGAVEDELSTGTERASRCVDGVLVPGVAGGVKAGERKEGGGEEVARWKSWRWSETGVERMGGVEGWRAGEAWAGSSVWLAMVGMIDIFGEFTELALFLLLLSGILKTCHGIGEGNKVL